MMRAIVAVRLNQETPSATPARQGERVEHMFTAEPPNYERVWMQVAGITLAGDLWGYVDCHPHHAELQYGDLLQVPRYEVEELVGH